MSRYFNFYRYGISFDKLCEELDCTGYAEITTHGEVINETETISGDVVTVDYVLEHEGEKCKVHHEYNLKTTMYEKFELINI